MNRADRMLEVLRDGRPHSRQEIFDRAGFMLTNNAASELRARGLDVEQWQESRGVFVYRLLGEGDAVLSGTSPAPTEAGDTDFNSDTPASLSPSEPVQLALIPERRGAYGEAA